MILQFKSATEVYGQATHCPVASSSPSIWIEYSKFQEERNRHRTAQKLYLKALVANESEDDGGAIKDEEGRKELWGAFLSMVRLRTNNPLLTLDQLREAAGKENTGQQPGASDETFVGSSRSGIGEAMGPIPVNDSSSKTLQEDAPPPPAKRTKIENAAAVIPTTAPTAKVDLPVPEAVGAPGDYSNETTGSNAGSITSKHPVSARKVEEDATTIVASLSHGLPPEVEAMWRFRDGANAPSRPDPPLFSPVPPR